MTDIPSLVESVLRLDKEATKGPWECDSDEDAAIATANFEVFAHHDDWGSQNIADSVETAANAELIATYRTAAPILATELTRLRSELQNCNDLCSIEDGGGAVSQVLARKLEKLRAELETERRKVEGLRKELHDVRSVCAEALDSLYDAQSVYRPNGEMGSNYWRWETTGEGLAGIEWDVTTPLTAEALAALTPSENGEG